MIQIKWTQIKDDVDRQTWRLAKVRIEDSELRNDAQEDDSQNSLRVVMRWAESGIAMVSTAIREQLSNSTNSVATDELDMEKESWTFTLKDSSNVDERALAMLIHKFVVEYILFRWCLTWSPNESGQWKESYVKTLSDLVESAFEMSEPTKDKRKVFEGWKDETEVRYE